MCYLFATVSLLMFYYYNFLIIYHIIIVYLTGFLLILMLYIKRQYITQGVFMTYVLIGFFWNVSLLFLFNVLNSELIYKFLLNLSQVFDYFLFVEL